MSRTCTVCSHPERQRIDALIVEALPNRRIADDFGLSESSVRRHAASHLPKVAVQAVTELREFDHFSKLRRLERVLYSVLSARLKDEDHGMVLRVHASLLRNMEFELQLSDLQEVKREIEQLKEAIHEREDMR